MFLNVFTTENKIDQRTVRVKISDKSKTDFKFAGIYIGKFDSTSSCLPKIQLTYKTENKFFIP